MKTRLSRAGVAVGAAALVAISAVPAWALQGGGPPPPIERRNDGDDRRRDEDRDFQIINAFWGAQGRSRDVTRILKERIRDGRLHIQASNQEMRGDPIYGVVKTLTVVYEVRGRRREVRIPEGGFLDLP
ncbi:MAG: hypothetical protein ABSG41_16325 [Bryobacteraceae bacterium]|jgi:hypothetical protein